MFQLGEKVMVFARVEKIIQDKDGTSYMVAPDDNKEFHLDRMVVPEDCVRVSDDEILKQMEAEQGANCLQNK